MPFDPDVLTAARELAEAAERHKHLPADERPPLPAQPLAVFNGALEEGAVTREAMLQLAREPGPLSLPALIASADLEELQALVLHELFESFFRDSPADE